MAGPGGSIRSLRKLRIGPRELRKGPASASVCVNVYNLDERIKRNNASGHENSSPSPESELQELLSDELVFSTLKV